MDLRILASGELQTGDGQFQVLPEPGDEAIPEEVLQLAMTEGAVLYEINLNPDLGEDYPQDDDIYAFGITDGEYWADDPDAQPEPSIKPISRWEPRLLLRVSAPCLRWQSPQLDLEIRAQAIYNPKTRGYDFAIALHPVSADRPASAQAIAVIQLHYLRRLAGDHPSDGPQGWQLGDDTTLRICPYPPGTQRYWDWPWAQQTFGPVYFWVFVDRTLAQLQDWFTHLQPHHYLDQGELLYRGEGSADRMCDRYRPVEPHIYTFTATDDGYRDLYLQPGCVQLLHGVHYKSGQAETDASLLASILAGDLGAVTSWMLIEGDYGVCQAAGRGLDSLRDYLDPNCDPAPLKQDWQQWMVTIDLHAAQDINQAMAIIGEYFRVPLPADNPTAAVSAWLATAPATELPCAIYLPYGPDLTSEDIQLVMSWLATAKVGMFLKGYG